MGGARRGSRRRRRQTASDAPATAPQAEADATGADAPSRGGYGRAALLLALLIGTVIEQIAADVLPTEALDVFHLAVLVGIAFFVARWYRGYMRRALTRRRASSRRSE